MAVATTSVPHDTQVMTKTVCAYNIAASGNEYLHDGYVDKAAWESEIESVRQDITDSLGELEELKDYVDDDTWAEVENIDAPSLKYLQVANEKLDWLENVLDNAKSAKEEHDAQVKAEREAAAKAKASAASTQTTTSYTSSGSGLTKSSGVNYRSDGIKETYYNLNMSTVVSNAKASGITGDYWVRGDGVKMYGDYVIVATSNHPKGTIVSTSLGAGIVIDVCPTYGIYDIAVTW